MTTCTSAVGRYALFVYAVLGGAYLAGEIASTDWLMTATKPLLMPVLFVVLATTGDVLRSPIGRLVGIAVFFSWLGDLGLMTSGDTWFLVGLGFFFLAQVAYGRAFWTAGLAGPLRRRPVLALPYIGWLFVLVGILAPHMGSLFVPVAMYGVVLVGMAALATGINIVTATGGALFVVSDSLLALGRFAEVDLPMDGFFVMVTYIAGQALIVLGVAVYVRTEARLTTER